MLKNNINLIRITCSFHTSCISNGQLGKFMKKIMGPSKKKFYVSQEIPVLPSTSAVLGKTSMEAKITGNPRRNNVLNKLFMKHITDIMSTGEYSKDILGFGIEVNKVKVSSDYKFLRVYWIARQSEKHEDIENLLRKNAGYLKHELSALRVMGQVPNIVFVRDKNYYKISEIQERLNRADFGEDYEKPNLTDQFKSEFEILTSLDSTVKEKLEKPELKSVDDFTTCDELDEVPPMPQNVLGLNHENILKRVKNGMSRSKAAHRSEDTSEWTQWSNFKSTQIVNEDPVKFANHQEQRKAFKAFLQQRQIMRMKERRLNKNWTADREYVQEELKERSLRNLHIEDETNEDYILEEVEDTKSEEIQLK